MLYNNVYVYDNSLRGNTYLSAIASDTKTYNDGFNNKTIPIFMTSILRLRHCMNQQYLRLSPMWPGDSVNMLEHKDEEEEEEEEGEEEEK